MDMRRHYHRRYFKKHRDISQVARQNDTEGVTQTHHSPKRYQPGNTEMNYRDHVARESEQGEVQASRQLSVTVRSARESLPLDMSRDDRSKVTQAKYERDALRTGQHHLTLNDDDALREFPHRIVQGASEKCRVPKKPREYQPQGVHGLSQNLVSYTYQPRLTPANDQDSVTFAQEPRVTQPIHENSMTSTQKSHMSQTQYSVSYSYQPLGTQPNYEKNVTYNYQPRAMRKQRQLKILSMTSNPHVVRVTPDPHISPVQYQHNELKNRSLVIQKTPKTQAKEEEYPAKHRVSEPDSRRGLYGVDVFKTSLHMRITEPTSHLPSAWSKNNVRSQANPSKMVLAVDRVIETVAVVPRPSYQESSVYTELEFSDHRRYHEQVNFSPVLHPVRFSDTYVLYLNNTRKRFITRTFYEPRVRPKSFSETTFTHPKSVEQRYVSCLDHHTDENKKWFKTHMELKAKKFTSTQILRSTNNNYINTSSAVSTRTSEFQSSAYILDEDSGLGMSSTTTERFTEKYDPGASQVFIPQRRERSLDDLSLSKGQIRVDFPKNKVDLNMNSPADYYSEA